jgi:hypothetical protein
MIAFVIVEWTAKNLGLPERKICDGDVSKDHTEWRWAAALD